MKPKNQMEIVNKIANSEWINGETDSVDELIKNYQKLNEKIDLVISKIKKRKEKHKQ